MPPDQDIAYRMDQRRQVALTIYPGFKTWEATGPLSVLSYATQQLTDAGHADGYDVTGSGASCHVAIAHLSTGRCPRALRQVRLGLRSRSKDI